MRYIQKRIKFNIYLLKSEVDQEDHVIIYDSDDPSNLSQIGNKITATDVGDADPSLFGDAWLFTTFTNATRVGNHDFIYTVYDQYSNEGSTSNTFSLDVCLTPTKPILTSPVYDEGEGELSFTIGQ